jgi:hypothetical protein
VVRKPASSVAACPASSAGAKSLWLKQIEIGLSISVRNLPRFSSLRSVAELEAQVMAFIAYYNQTMAKPLAWT